MSQYRKQKILLLMSGSIACVKATSFISDQRHPFLLYINDGEPMSGEDSGALADCIGGLLMKVS